MADILNHTIKVLLKTCRGKVGYILKTDDKGWRIIANIGGDLKILARFNKSLYEILKTSGGNKPILTELPGYQEVIISHSINESKIIFLKPDRRNRKDYYLLIFSENNLDNIENIEANADLINNLSILLQDWPDKNEDEQPETDSGGTENKVKKPLMEISEEDDFETLWGIIPEFVFKLDQSGCFTKINKYGAVILEYSVDELLGKHFFDLIVKRERVKVAEAFQELLSTGKTIRFETTLVSKFENEFIFDINCKPNLNDKMRIDGLLGFGRNITECRYFEKKLKLLNTRLIESNRLLSIERNRANQRKSMLEELNRLKNEFISNISHELRTPLASIIGFSETIASDKEMLPEMKDEFNEIILTEGKRLAKLINEVLDVTRVESGNIDLNKTRFNIVKTLTKVIDSNKKAIEEHQLVLNYDFPPDEIFINGDEEKIGQTFNALINNAIKFTPKEGRIAIIAKSLYKEFELIISDTGIGIPAKDLPYIFEKFYRVSRPGTEIPGTGLGLVFVKQIVDLHKGFISVESELSRGTTFLIKFPKISKV